MARESFNSRLGFILVSAGCAIGIGNVWRFPFITGENGGGFFVLFYLLFLVIMGLPVLTMELAVGRGSRKSAVSAYRTLKPENGLWTLHGWAALLGCVVGSHTYEHSSFVGASNETISRVLNQASESISAAGVSSPRFFRPVGGAVSESQLNYISSLGYITIGWSIDTNDWNGHPKTSDKFSSDPEKKAAYEAFVQEKVNWILEKADDGDIILMHDIYMSSVDIFIRAADALIERGFELVTVSEILGENILTQSRPVMYISRNEYLTHMD